MKTKIPHLMLACLFGATIASQGAATLINVDDANNGTVAGGFQSGTPSLGTLSISTQLAASNGSSAPMGYTITGLDLDGMGGTNDSVVINFLVTSSNGTINARPTGTGSGDLGELATNDAGNNGSWLNSNNANLEISFTDISANLNGGSNNGWAAFNGFYELNLNSWGGTDETNINGVFYDASLGDTTPFAISGDTLAIDLEPDGASTTQFRLRDWSFSFSAVPEPSSTALLGLGGLALMLRRKRSAA